MIPFELFDYGWFGPDALKALGLAFDQAWADIKGNFGGDPQQIEIARLILANALLKSANNRSRDVAALKRAGLAALAKRYRL